MTCLQPLLRLKLTRLLLHLQCTTSAVHRTLMHSSWAFGLITFAGMAHTAASYHCGPWPHAPTDAVVSANSLPLDRSGSAKYSSPSLTDLRSAPRRQHTQQEVGGCVAASAVTRLHSRYTSNCCNCWSQLRCCRSVCCYTAAINVVPSAPQ
jgi:hypothetical protein